MANTLKVNLDYAVFLPGSYPDNNLTGKDPSGGTEYVYAFQAFNVSSNRTLTVIDASTTRCQGIHDLSIDALHATTGGVAPSLLVNNSPILFVDFLAPQLPAGGFSTVFLFTSPNPPMMSSIAIQDGSLAGTGTLPMPTVSAPVAPDWDADCDVDVDDYSHFLACITGPAIPQNSAACVKADFDGDGDVDQSDYGIFQRCFSGSNTIAPAGCDQ